MAEMWPPNKSRAKRCPATGHKGTSNGKFFETLDFVAETAREKTMPKIKTDKQIRRDLRRRVGLELNQTHRGWIGKTKKIRGKLLRVRIRANQFKALPHHKETVNQMGRIFGCHTCLTHAHRDRNQPWIGDHIPPTELKEGVRDWICEQKGRSKGTQVLFPQCHRCSSQQAAKVRFLNSLTTEEAKLRIQGDQNLYNLVVSPKTITTKNCIPATGRRVSVPEGKKIQKIGVRDGCHSCGTLYPAPDYDADHIIPVEFCTSYMPKVLKSIGYRLTDDDYQLRPQCKRCSSHQGGKMSAIRKLGVEYARRKGIECYKY